MAGSGNRSGSEQGSGRQSGKNNEQSKNANGEFHGRLPSSIRIGAKQGSARNRMLALKRH
jgi:hypothetical protein